MLVWIICKGFYAEYVGVLHWGVLRSWKIPRGSLGPCFRPLPDPIHSWFGKEAHATFLGGFNAPQVVGTGLPWERH